MKTRLVSIVACALLVACSLLGPAVSAQPVYPDTSVQAGLTDLLVPPNERFGLNRASYGADHIPGQKLHLAAQAGAAWNRWPLYWYQVEDGDGIDYSVYDRAVTEDLNRGTNLDIVLMGTPSDYSTAGVPTIRPPRLGERRPANNYIWRAGSEGPSASSQASTPQNLELPVFADGTDDYAPGKAINPENYWARFVNLTVQRYKPDGVLAEHGLVPPGVGVRYWEVWNEPDVPFYWYGRGPGSDIQDYARLLKVTHLAAKSADPGARIVVGGLAFWGRPSWLPDLLDLIKADPMAESRGYFFDVISWHVYSRTVDVFNRGSWTRHLLADKQIRQKEVWINEMNVPTWGDPTPYSRDAGTHRATPDEQASFILQGYAYGFHAGVDRIFTFMLYDDCWQWGEHYGLVRNPPGEYSISDCAGDGEPRPSYQAYKLAAHYLRDIKASNLQSLGPGGMGEVVTFDKHDGSRVSVIWNKGGTPVSIDVPVRGPATLINQNGVYRAVYPNSDGVVTLHLPPATANDAYLNAPPDYIIGGETFLLVENAPAKASGTLLNGGFEMRPDFAAWWYGGVTPGLSPFARSGDRSAVLKVDPPNTGQSWVRQSLVLPADSGPVLEFWYAINTTQPATAPRAEQSIFEVTVSENGGPETVLLEDTQAHGWRRHSVGLSEYAGSVVTLTFRLRGTHWTTAAYVDDVTLWPYQLLLPVVGSGA